MISAANMDHPVAWVCIICGVSGLLLVLLALACGYGDD